MDEFINNESTLNAIEGIFIGLIVLSSILTVNFIIYIKIKNYFSK